MANKKIDYEDEKIYRKNIDLSGKTIKAIEKLAKKDNREFKPFLELEIQKLLKKK